MDEQTVVASIEYYAFSGKVREVMNFSDAARFRKEVEESCYCGEPIGLVLYPDGKGEYLKTGWLEGLGTLPLSMRKETQPFQKSKADTYEIYQITDVGACSYGFCGYEMAQEQLRAQDYQHQFTGIFAPEANLETLFMLHNRDDRPLGKQMRSLSVSDVIVTHRGGKTTAYYVDSFGFAEVPGFAQKLEQMEKQRKHKQKHHREQGER